MVPMQLYLLLLILVGCAFASTQATDTVLDLAITNHNSLTAVQGPHFLQRRVRVKPDPNTQTSRHQIIDRAMKQKARRHQQTRILKVEELGFDATPSSAHGERALYLQQSAYPYLTCGPSAKYGIYFSLTPSVACVSDASTLNYGLTCFQLINSNEASLSPDCECLGL